MRQKALFIVLVLGLLIYTVGTAAATERAMKCFGIPVTANGGGSGADEAFYGTPGVDVINAGGGNDVIYGYGGNDVLCGGQGADRIFGGRGNDLLSGGGGSDLLKGGGGNDDLFGNGGKDRLKGGNGVDFLYGGAGKDILKGGNGDDELYGEGGNDRLLGNGGNNYLLGHPGFDRVNGGLGANTCDNRDDVLINCGGGMASMQPFLPAVFGSDTLTGSQFVPDPSTYSVTSGGSVDVFGQLGGNCAGWASEAPDYQITYSGTTPANLLRFFFVSNKNSADTTLVVNDPNGIWHCNDDAGLGGNWRNPMIDFTPGIIGVYDIWVGSLFANKDWAGTLSVTEFGGVTP